VILGLRIEIFCFQLQLGVDESYTLSVSKAGESSVAWEATIEVFCILLITVYSLSILVMVFLIWIFNDAFYCVLELKLLVRTSTITIIYGIPKCI